MQSQWNFVLPYDALTNFLRPAFCIPPVQYPPAPPPPPAVPSPTRYTLEEIIPLIKAISSEIYHATTLEFMDDDDDSEVEESVGLEALRTHTKITVLDSNTGMCAVCQEDFKVGDISRTLRCRHAFHMYCIDRVLENSVNCPMCRMTVAPDEESLSDDPSDEL